MTQILTLPVVSGLNTRVSVSNLDPSTSAIAGIGRAGLMVAGRSTLPTDKDARFVNCFKHTVTDALGQKKVMCVRRSGLGGLNTPQSGSIGTAILVWAGQGTGTKVISAFGGTNSSIYDGTTQLATNNADTTVITGKASFITETTVSDVATLYITSTDSTAWYYQSGGTVTKISDAQYPGNNSKTLAGGGCHMDGYTFQMDTLGGIWNSDLNSITSWTASGVINATSYPDKGVAALRWRTYIIGFGTQSMEFFYNAGNAQGSPLSRVAHMAKKIGAVNADAITQISDVVFFCGSTPESGLTIYQFDGEISRVSPPEIDALLLISGPSAIKMTALRDFGLSFILVKAGNTIYAYCIEEKFWFNWQSDLGFVRFAGLSVGSAQAVYGVSELSTAGKVFTINPQARTFQDNGMTFSSQMRLQKIDPGQGRFCAYERAELVADTQSSTSPVTLVWSDDDYQTYSSARSLDMADEVPRTTALGGTRKPRSFALAHASNTPFRIEALRLRVRVAA